MAESDSEKQADASPPPGRQTLLKLLHVCKTLLSILKNKTTRYSLIIFLVVRPESEEDHQMRRRRRGLLRMYYGVDDSAPVQQDNPLDIDKAGFKSDMYMDRTLKEQSLNELYKQEERMKKGVACLCDHTPSHIHHHLVPLFVYINVRKNSTHCVFNG